VNCPDQLGVEISKLYAKEIVVVFAVSIVRSHPQHAQLTARRPPSVLILMAPDDVRPRVMEEKGEG